MLDNEAMKEIAGVLDGVEWEPEMLEMIANILRAAGYTVRDPFDAAVECWLNNRLDDAALVAIMKAER